MLLGSTCWSFLIIPKLVAVISTWIRGDDKKTHRSRRQPRCTHENPKANRIIDDSSHRLHHKVEKLRTSGFRVRSANNTMVNKLDLLVRAPFAYVSRLDLRCQFRKSKVSHLVYHGCNMSCICYNTCYNTSNPLLHCFYYEICSSAGNPLFKHDG